MLATLNERGIRSFRASVSMTLLRSELPSTYLSPLYVFSNPVQGHFTHFHARSSLPVPCLSIEIRQNINSFPIVRISIRFLRFS